MSNINSAQPDLYKLVMQLRKTGGLEMAKTPEKQGTNGPESREMLNTLTHLQEAGLGNMMNMSTVWLEAISDMGAEVAGFLAERIKEDVKTQHEILHCKNVGDMQSIQAAFIQKAMDQYQEETGKLLKIGTEAFAAPAVEKAK
ncbi:MAG: phasin family protein [Paracoccaceae bacterium]|nr:phasin family protein [Paracoccaceae bacterium]